MPLHDSRRVEFKIESGYIQIRTDDGKTVPAYWAHPDIGQNFSGICLLHDWWGTTDITRMLRCPVFHVNGEDPEAVAQVVEVYAPGQGYQAVGAAGTLDGGDVLPGFSLAVKDIFPGKQ